MNKLRRPSLCPKVPCFRRHLTTTANNQTFQGRKSMHPTTCLTFFLPAATLTDFRPPIVIPAWEGSRRSETRDSFPIGARTTLRLIFFTSDRRREFVAESASGQAVSGS